MIYVNGNIVTQDHFSAGELKIKLHPSTRDRIDIAWHYENDAEYFTVACIRHYFAEKSCILYLPYVPHARMDRVKNPEDVFTLKTFAHLINSLMFDKVMVWDVHSNVSLALIDRIENINPMVWIDEAIQLLGYAKNSITLFFPDEGAQKRYGEMYPDYKQAFGIKKRNWETGKIEGYMIVGEEHIKDKYVLIIDDICSYGNTFVKAAEAIRAAGAVDISLFVTHCEDAIIKGDIFKNNVFENVFTTNSLIRSEETDSKLTVIH